LFQEETSEGELGFTMTFQSTETPYKVWAEPERVERFTRFFGPGVVAEVSKLDAEKRMVALKLTTTKTQDASVASTAATASTTPATQV